LIDAPFSGFAESIRALKMSADAQTKRSGARVIGFTSSLPQEGKSTIAAAFGGLAGLVGAKVIVVDCDLRNPALSRYLTPRAKAGLLEVMSGELSVASVVWREPCTGIDFLPAVNVQRLSQTAQLLSAAPMTQLFEDLRSRYDYVVVDLSPLLPVVDVRATTELIDFYFFVVEWGRTQSEVVREALNSARKVYEKTLGFTLNKVNQKAIGRYSSYYGAYGDVALPERPHEGMLKPSPISLDD
jgi:succinoglycan biosynthesis transport protein ExoP